MQGAKAILLKDHDVSTNSGVRKDCHVGITDNSESINAAQNVLKYDLTFTGSCIVIYFYSKTNQMHQCLRFILFYFGVTHYILMFSVPKCSTLIYNKQRCSVKHNIHIII